MSVLQNRPPYTVASNPHTVCLTYKIHVFLMCQKTIRWKKCDWSTDNSMNDICGRSWLLANNMITIASNGHENSIQASFCNLALRQHPNLGMRAKLMTTAIQCRCQPNGLLQLRSRTVCTMHQSATLQKPVSSSFLESCLRQEQPL